MKRYKDQYNIILLDWAPLSLYKEAAKFSLKFINHYLDASRNAIDVGNFVGRCLSGLSRYWLPIKKTLQKAQRTRGLSSYRAQDTRAQFIVHKS